MQSLNWIRVSLALALIYGLLDLCIGYALDTHTTLVMLLDTLQGLARMS